MYSLLLSIFVAVRMFTESLPSNDEFIVIKTAHMSKYILIHRQGARVSVVG
jgi:hypothetical protein